MLELQQDLALAQAHLACYLDKQPQPQQQHQQPYTDINNTLQVVDIPEASTGMIVGNLENGAFPYDPFSSFPFT